MLRRLRNTLLLVAMGIFMLLAFSTVSRANETKPIVVCTNETGGVSDVIKANNVAKLNQDLFDVAEAEASNEEILNTSEYAETISSMYNKHKEALFSENATLTEKYANLLTICYCQVSQLYINGEIPYDWYVLQRAPFVEKSKELLTASDDEILEGYSSLLFYSYDTMNEEILSGYEIDQELFDFVSNEINSNNLEV